MSRLGLGLGLGLCLGLGLGLWFEHKNGVLLDAHVFDKT